ncbi:flagellar protein [Eubacterium oxidoreducens]|uniref:Flagellar operon protein TIGR03826 n=1 Tax=Eubacterium oxidoreducens TaxID=1732 RepID=A0A1G6ACS5_EUBOX|nr:flagellar protein [Eubacterium oxidoreducens]SDB06255.1 flagellar operon protein TIGR03826 [Eubacterium oxidoreducens]
MEVKNCKECGRLFNWMNGPKICPACVKKVEDKFQEVKEYVRNNKGASLEQISEDNDVAIKQIKQWVREERLVFAEDSMVGIDCELCGKMIRTGKYCNECKDKVQNNLATGIKQKPKVEPKKPVKDNPRMRFLDK